MILSQKNPPHLYLKKQTIQTEFTTSP